MLIIESIGFALDQEKVFCSLVPWALGAWVLEDLGVSLQHVLFEQHQSHQPESKEGSLALPSNHVLKNDGSLHCYLLHSQMTIK